VGTRLSGNEAKWERAHRPARLRRNESAALVRVGRAPARGVVCVHARGVRCVVHARYRRMRMRHLQRGVPIPQLSAASSSPILAHLQRSGAVRAFAMATAAWSR
jgi:hypothetical protein